MASLFSVKNGQDLLQTNEPQERRLLVEDLIPHTQNREYQKERVEALAYNIENKGLLQPIVVNIDTKTGAKEILAGHHRVKAYQHLHYKTGSDDYLMIRSWVFENMSDEEKLIVLLSTNPEFDSSEQDRLKTLGYAQDLYQLLIDREEKPKGRRREWLMATTGFSEWFIRKHDEGINEIVENSPQNEEHENVDEEDVFIQKKIQRILKTYQKTYDDVSDISSVLSDEEKQSIRSWLNDTLGLLT